MATIGLDRLYYARSQRARTARKPMASSAAGKAMTAELSIELAEAVLYADDGAAEVIKDFKSGTLSLGVDDIGIEAASDLTGAVADDNGVLISASENWHACGHRLSGDEARRQIPLLLAVQGEVRHPRHQPADQGRVHYLLHTDH